MSEKGEEQTDDRILEELAGEEAAAMRDSEIILV